MSKPNWTLCAALLSLAILTACSAPSTALFETARAAFFKNTSADSQPLNSNFRYLRITTGDGRVALVVLGYIDQDPSGPVEVWYSAEREALRLQNGRVVGAVGLPTEWHNVSVPPLPDWNTLAAGRQPLEWVRTRDVLPGYRIGIRDRLSLRRMDSPRSSQLRWSTADLVWFEERAESTERPASALPPARYAVRLRDGAATVIYGEQCLSAELCFSWQRWPVESPQTPAGR